MIAIGSQNLKAFASLAHRICRVDLKRRRPENLLVEELVVGRVLDHQDWQSRGIRLPFDRGFEDPGAAYVNGIVSENVDPRPASLTTVRLPPSTSASRRDNGSPSPVPFTSR